MVIIKRLGIGVIIVVVCGIGIALGIRVLLPTPVERVVEEIEQVVEEKIEEHVVREEAEETIAREDPVRDFLSDTLQQALDFFFTQKINVVTLGDSLTEGVGDETENNGYIGVLDDTINHTERLVRFKNFAKRGSRSGQLIERLDDEEVQVSLGDADIIFITIGANDIMQIFKENITNLQLEQFTSEQIRYEQRLEIIFSKIREFNGEADIYLIGFYNPFRTFFPEVEELEQIITNWNQIGEDVTERFAYVSFIPIKDIFDYARVNYYAKDQFHPNALGYRMIAQRILEVVVDEGAGEDEQE